MPGPSPSGYHYIDLRFYKNYFCLSYTQQIMHILSRVKCFILLSTKAFCFAFVYDWFALGKKSFSILDIFNHHLDLTIPQYSFFLK